MELLIIAMEPSRDVECFDEELLLSHSGVGMGHKTIIMIIMIIILMIMIK